MDIKKIVLWLVIIMVVSFAIAGISFGSYFNSGSWKSERITFTEEKVIDLKDVKKIHIISSSSGVRVVPTENSQVKANLEVIQMGNSGAAPTLKTETANGVITIEVVNYPGRGFSSITNKLDIAIPAGYDQELSIDVLSGGTTVNNFKLESFNYKGSSGGLRTQDLIAKTANVSVMSGSVKMSGFAGDLKVNGSSGSIDIDYKEYQNNNINIRGMSGNIELRLPSTAQFNLDASTMSGNVESSFPVTIQGKSVRNSIRGEVGKGTGSVTVSTNSGNVKIQYN